MRTIERARFVSRPHLERGMDGSLGWRPDYKSRSRLSSAVAYGQYADFGVKASVTAMSTALLLQATEPTAKIVFGITTVLLGVITVASAFEAF